jgi:hypothetical protein
MAQSTWSADTATWTNTAYIWSNDTYQSTATLAGNSSITSSAVALFPSTATLASSLGSVTGEDKDTNVTSLLNLETAMISSSAVAIPVTATLATELGDFKTNINFEESVTLSATASTSSDNSFLWNNIEEDEDTLWTKISDPDN